MNINIILMESYVLDFRNNNASEGLRTERTNGRMLDVAENKPMKTIR